MNKIPFSFFRENRVFMLSLVILIFSIVGLMVLSFGISFMTNEIQEVENQNMITRNEVVSDRYTRLVRTLNDTKTKYEALHELQIQKDSFIPFVRQLELAAVSSNIVMTIETVASSNTQVQPSYSIPIARYRLDISGSSGSIAKYLSLLHTLTPLIHIEHVSMSSEDAENLNHQTRAEVTIVVAVEEEV